MAKKKASPKAIAYRYAYAFYLLAKEKKVIEAVKKDLNQLAVSLNDVPAAYKALSNRRVPVTEKEAVIDALVKKGKPHKLTANFLKLLVREERFALFAQIVDQFNMVYDDDHGIRHVTAVTAAKLNKKQHDVLQTSLKTALNAKDVRMETSVDTSLLGGILIRFGSTLVDDTIKNKLNRISQKMKGIA